MRRISTRPPFNNGFIPIKSDYFWCMTLRLYTLRVLSIASRGITKGLNSSPPPIPLLMRAPKSMGSDSIDLLTEAYLYQCEVNPVSALNNQGEVIAQHVYTSRVGGQRLANKSIESDPIDSAKSVG